MKLLFLILLLLISNPLYSQINYIRVEPKTEKEYEHKEGYFDNAAFFVFALSDYFLYSKCAIVGYLPEDFPAGSKVAFKTGWEYEYTEDENFTGSDGKFIGEISTQNLPQLAIIVWYEGEKRNAYLENVSISFYKKKF